MRKIDPLEQGLAILAWLIVAKITDDEFRRERASRGPSSNGLRSPHERGEGKSR